MWSGVFGVGVFVCVSVWCGSVWECSVCVVSVV